MKLLLLTSLVLLTACAQDNTEELLFKVGDCLENKPSVVMYVSWIKIEKEEDYHVFQPETINTKYIYILRDFDTSSIIVELDREELIVNDLKKIDCLTGEIK